MGIVGLAYAYVITYWLVFLSTQVFIAWHPYLKKFQLLTQSRLLNLYKLKGLLREGSYMGMMACSEVAGFTVLMVLVGYLGHIALASVEAASQYLCSISSLNIRVFHRYCLPSQSKRASLLQAYRELR